MLEIRRTLLLVFVTYMQPSARINPSTYAISGVRQVNACSLTRYRRKWSGRGWRARLVLRSPSSAALDRMRLMLRWNTGVSSFVGRVGYRSRSSTICSGCQHRCASDMLRGFERPSSSAFVRMAAVLRWSLLAILVVGSLAYDCFRSAISFSAHCDMPFSIPQQDALNKHSKFCRATQLRWGGEPFCQFVLPLNWLGDPAKVKLRFDWRSYQQGRDFCRYFNTYGWRSYPIWEYHPRKYEPAPFLSLCPQEVSR